MFLQPVASKGSLHLRGQFDPLQRPIEQGKLVYEDEDTGLAYGPQPASWPGRRLLTLRGCAGANIQGTTDGPVRVVGPFTTNVHPNACVRGKMEPVCDTFNQETQTRVFDTFPPVFVGDDWVDKSHVEYAKQLSPISAVLHGRAAFTRPNYGPPGRSEPNSFKDEDVVFAWVLLYLIEGHTILDDPELFQGMWDRQNDVHISQQEFDIRYTNLAPPPMTFDEVTTKLKQIITKPSAAVCFGFDSSIPQLNYLLQL